MAVEDLKMEEQKHSVSAVNLDRSPFGEDRGERRGKVVVTRVGTTMLDELQKVAPCVEFVACPPADPMREIVDADALFGPITPQLFRVARRLTWVHTYSAGEEGSQFPEFVNSTVVLTNTRIIQGPQVADHALALLLALTRSLSRVIAGRPRAEWLPKHQYKAIELQDKTAVVVGMGGVGLQIAHRAHAFGMTVLGIDPEDITTNQDVSRIVKPEVLDTVLPQADVVFVSAPLTRGTEGMFDLRRFQLMKQGVYFIAVSRGRLYSAEALVQALSEGRIAGAGVDVVEPEPLPSDHPLWRFDNVIITPHVGAISDHLMERQRELLKDNLARWVKGSPLRNVVDKRKGY
jgi:phosphoglycerate dehydrogenase-like enzyme